MRKLIYSRYKLEVAVVKESSNVRELKTIDWEYSSILSLMSISSYVVRSTKETGSIHQALPCKKPTKICLGFHIAKIWNGNSELYHLNQWWPTFWVLSPGVVVYLHFWSHVPPKLSQIY